MFTAREYVELGGGLISYGPSVDDLVRRAVIYVDRVLKGARPSDLSVEHPTRFELTINLKTGKALHLDISAALRPGDRVSHASFVAVHESASGTTRNYGIAQPTPSPLCRARCAFCLALLPHTSVSHQRRRLFLVRRLTGSVV